MENKINLGPVLQELQVLALTNPVVQAVWSQYDRKLIPLDQALIAILRGLVNGNNRLAELVVGHTIQSPAGIRLTKEGKA